MILECPSCHARFKVAESAIPIAGRTVRCSKCAHEWHVDRASLLPDVPKAAPVAPPAPVAKENEELSPAARAEGEAFMDQLNAIISASETEAEPDIVRPAAVKRPAPAKGFKLPPLHPKPFKMAVPVIAALWLVLAFMTYFPSWEQAPVLGGIYHLFGVTSTEGLEFADVTMEREHEEGGKTKFILAGSIRNNSSETRDVPTVRVKLRDSKGDTIFGRSYPVNTQLQPGEVYPFKINNVETMFASNVSVIKVDMGNPFQLMVR